jgi:hypothetical protein
MFLPLFIAILMGLVSPSHHTTSTNHCGSTTVSTMGDEEEDPGDEDPGDTGEDGPGGTGTGGGTGQNPPPKP